MTKGGCLCGAVRFEVAGEPVAIRACWCRVCQYIGTGSGTVNAVFASDGLAVTGETRALEGVADSGVAMTRRFCPKCGTHLFSNAAARPHQVVIRVGALDDPASFAPQATIWVSAAPPWACISEDLPKFEGQAAPSKG